MFFEKLKKKKTRMQHGYKCLCFLFTLVLVRVWTRLKVNLTLFYGIKWPGQLFFLWFKVMNGRQQRGVAAWETERRATLPDWTFTKLL